MTFRDTNCFSVTEIKIDMYAMQPQPSNFFKAVYVEMCRQTAAEANYFISWNKAVKFYPTKNQPFISSLEFLCRQPSCPSTLLRLERQSFPLWHFTLTFSTKQAAEWKNMLFFLPPFIERVCPSAPVLKINHHTARHAHDFNMSSKEKERERQKKRCNTHSVAGC